MIEAGFMVDLLYITTYNNAGPAKLGKSSLWFCKVGDLWTNRKAFEVYHEFEGFSDLPKLCRTENAETTKVQQNASLDINEAIKCHLKAHYFSANIFFH